MATLRDRSEAALYLARPGRLAVVVDDLAELRAWLDGPTLVRLWRALYLPKGVRRAWEERHPLLRAAV